MAMLLITDNLNPQDREDQLRKATVLLALVTDGIKASGSESEEYTNIVRDISHDLMMLTSQADDQRRA